AFNDPENPFLLHHHDRQSVVYTGTHDNDTTHGWYATLPPQEKQFLRRYLGRESTDIAWDLIRLAWSSVADLAIAPLQDVLDLGSEGRMNFPGKPAGNWAWRFQEGQLTDQVRERLLDITQVYDRVPKEPAPSI